MEKLWIGYSRFDEVIPKDFKQLMNIVKHHVQEELELYSVSLNIKWMNALMSNWIHLKRLVLSGIDLDSDIDEIFISPHSLKRIEHIELGEWYNNMDKFKLEIIKSIVENEHQFPKLNRLFLRFEEIHHADEIKSIIERIKDQRSHLKVDLKIKGSKY